MTGVKVFQRKEHRELWYWMADNPGKKTGDWPGWKKNGGPHENTEHDCFACKYSPECAEEGLGGPTTVCPLAHTPDVDGYCLGGLSWRHMFAEGEERRELALKIANLPVREGVLTNDESQKDSRIPGGYRQS